MSTCFQPSRKQILKELNFTEETQCNIYQIGSRVYGTFRNDSDYDFFMIISDDFYERLNENYKSLLVNYRLDGDDCCFHNKFKDSWIVYYNSDQSLETIIVEQSSESDRSNNRIERFGAAEVEEEGLDGKSGMGREFQCLSLKTRCGTDLNINLYNYTSFKKRLQSNWIQSIMCYSMSEKFVPSLDFPELHSCFKLYFRKIALSAIAEASNHYRLAKKYWNSDDPYRSKKYIVHTFRDLLFAIQIVKYRKIVDFSQSNDLYYEIMNKVVTERADWSHYDSIYYVRYQKLKEELNELVMLPPTLKEVILQHHNPINNNNTNNNIIQQYFSRMNNDFESICEELESYFSLHVVHKTTTTNDSNVCEYLFMRGTDETPLYSQFTLQVFNGCLFAKSNRVVQLLCLYPIKIIPVGHRYQPKLDIKKGCSIWKIEPIHHDDKNTTILLVHIYYDSFTKSWNILQNNHHDGKSTSPISETEIWEKLEQLVGFSVSNPTEENAKRLTFSFELLLEGETIKQIHLVSIQDTTKEEMVADFTNSTIYPTKWVRHNEITSLAHISKYAIRLNPLETKEILILDKTSIVSVTLPQYNLLINNNSSITMDEKKVIELLRTSINDSHLLEKVKEYVVVKQFQSPSTFDSIYNKILLLIDKICSILMKLNTANIDGIEMLIGQSFSDVNFVKVFLLSLQQQLKKAQQHSKETIQWTTTATVEQYHDFVCCAIKEIDGETFWRVASLFLETV